MGRKQMEIEGTERTTHPDVADAAEKYIIARDERMELTKKEVAAKNDLVAIVKKHELPNYEDDDVIVTFDAEVKETIKAKRRAVVDGEIDVEA